MQLETLVALFVAPFVGSFLGVVIDRLPAARPLLLARSACDECGRRLRVGELVPVVSYLSLGGRCGCGKLRLSPFYPAIELAALAVAASAVWVLSGWLLWVSLALGWTLLALAAIDLRHYLLPDVLTLALIPAGLAVALALDPALLPAHLLGALLGFATFVVIGQVYRRLRGRDGLGLGDAKLLAAAGAWLGWAALPSVVAIGAVLALALALAQALGGAKLALTGKLAFGPHLALAFWLVWLCGPLILG
jgi:leader peptidase (prepilin peptidase) / N-methyltransferase